jgi:hypothetical protein
MLIIGRVVQGAGGSLGTAAALTAGYRLFFLIATGIAVLAAAVVAIQLRSGARPRELPTADPVPLGPARPRRRRRSGARRSFPAGSRCVANRLRRRPDPP